MMVTKGIPWFKKSFAVSKASFRVSLVDLYDPLGLPRLALHNKDHIRSLPRARDDQLNALRRSISDRVSGVRKARVFRYFLLSVSSVTTVSCLPKSSQVEPIYRFHGSPPRRH
jgi:hypothetical protein